VVYGVVGRGKEMMSIQDFAASEEVSATASDGFVLRSRGQCRRSSFRAGAEATSFQTLQCVQG